MIPIILILAWLAVGAAVGLVEARHGHWHKGWVVSAVLGPFAIPLAVQARRQEVQATPAALEGGQRRPGLAVLVGIDGSASSRHAAATVAGLLGDRVGQLTLAEVLDYETAARVGHGVLGPGVDWPERRQAVATLHEAAGELASRTGLHPGTVLLAGDPPVALAAHAAAHHYDLVVVATRGRGMAKRLFGSCAEGLARSRGAVPVLLVPATATTAQEAPAAAAPLPRARRGPLSAGR